MDRIRDGDLYALLAVSSVEDLDPIVKILLSAPNNSLKQDPVYKEHAPNHCMYAEQIGNDLLLFGGDALSNLFRGGKGPSYGEVVLDVCQSLHSPCKAGDVAENESTLLTLYMQGQWHGLTEAQRTNLVAEARRKASASVSDLVDWAESDPPWAVLAPVRQWIGPAYWITAPCVMHIAFLRRRLLNATTQATATHVTANDVRVREDATGLVILGGNDDRPLLSLVPVRVPVHSEGWRDVAATDDNGIGRLNPLLQAVPSIASAAEGFGALGATYYRVVADGTLVNSSTAGAFRGMVKGATSYESHANLFKPERLQAILGPAALLQIASVIVGQVHLADISKKLKGISAAVDRIIEFQQEKRRAKITAAISYFQQVASSILHGELDASIRAQLETAEYNLLALCNHLESELEGELERFAVLKDEARIGSASSAAAIKTVQNRLKDLHEQHLLCIRARVYGLRLLIAFPNTRWLHKSRQNDIVAALGSEADRDARLARIATLMRAKIDELWSGWDMMGANRVKLDLLAWNATFAASVTAGFDAVVRDIRQVDRLATTAAVIVKVQDGCIVAMCAEPLSEPTPA